MMAGQRKSEAERGKWGAGEPGSLPTKVAKRQRRQMFKRFLDTFVPSADDTVLDVGVTNDRVHDHSNYFEAWYPHKARVTASGLEDASFLEKAYPGVRFVQANGLDLPFEDNSYDYVHSSAVIEHVGSYANQAAFLRELWRVARRGLFVTTPNRWFPIEAHTVMPLIHFLPPQTFRAILRMLGKEFFAREENLNLMSKGTLAEAARIAGITEFRAETVSLFGWPSNLLLIAKKPSWEIGRLCERAVSEADRAAVVDAVIERLIRPQHQAVFWGDRLLTLDKAAGFKNDPAFKAAVASADSHTGQNQYASPDGISWRFHTLIWAARSCLKLSGDFVECGTYRGDMSWVLSEVVDIEGMGKKFYLYDTFAGFDPRYSSPEDFPHSERFYSMVDADYRDPTNETHVRSRFAAKPYVIVTKGSVPDVLAEVSPQRIAFLHLDLNSAAAERGALDVLFDRITPGGIIVFDDYGWAVHFKQKEAIDSFMKEKSIEVLELPTGQAMAIKR